MTRKDYILIAKAIKDSFPTDNQQEMMTMIDGWREVATTLATALATENSRFDRERFLTACGVSIA